MNQSVPRNAVEQGVARLTESRAAREELLCGLFAGVLGVASVGGDSVVSIQPASRTRKAGLVVTHEDVSVGETAGAGPLAAVGPGALQIVMSAWTMSMSTGPI